MKTLSVMILVLGTSLILGSPHPVEASTYDAPVNSQNLKNQFKGYNPCQAGYQRKFPHTFFFDRSCIPTP